MKSALSTLRCRIVLALYICLGLFCTRDNPDDIFGRDSLASSKRQVTFVQDTIFAYLLDPVPIKILSSNTTPGKVDRTIAQVYFNWRGGLTMNDSIPGTDDDSIIITRAFPADTVTAYMEALDNYGERSPRDSVVLAISRSIPKIITIESPDSIAVDEPFRIRVTATDAGGILQDYIWAKDGKTFKDTVYDNIFPVTLSIPGETTMLVKVKDNKNSESEVRSIRITVIDSSHSSN